MKDHSDENPMVLPSADEYQQPEPEFVRGEPEDNFSLSARLRMTMNHIANHGSFDQRRLIELLKDAKITADNHTLLIASVEDHTEAIRGLLTREKQA